MGFDKTVDINSFRPASEPLWRFLIELIPFQPLPMLLTKLKANCCSILNLRRYSGVDSNHI